MMRLQRRALGGASSRARPTSASPTPTPTPTRGGNGGACGRRALEASAANGSTTSASTSASTSTSTSAAPARAPAPAPAAEAPAAPAPALAAAKSAAAGAVAASSFLLPYALPLAALAAAAAAGDDDPAAAADAALSALPAAQLEAVLRPLLTAATLLCIVRIPMTWYPALDGTKLPWSLAYAPTELFLRATRRVVPPVGGVDVTPIVWVALLSFASEILLGPQGLLILVQRQQAAIGAAAVGGAGMM